MKSDGEEKRLAFLKLANQWNARVGYDAPQKERTRLEFRDAVICAKDSIKKNFQKPGLYQKIFEKNNE